MAMAGIGRFDSDSRDVGFKYDIDDIAQRDVAVVRPLVVAPANMNAHLFGWNRLQRIIEIFDMAFYDFTKLLDAKAGIVRVGARRQVRAVELQDETGVDDGLVLSAHGVGDCLHIGFFVGIIFVSEKADKTAGRKRRHENAMGLAYLHG